MINSETDFVEIITNVILNKDYLVNYLLYKRAEYRTARGLGPDEEDKLLHYTYAIDDIVYGIEQLEDQFMKQQQEARVKFEESKKN